MKKYIFIIPIVLIGFVFTFTTTSHAQDVVITEVQTHINEFGVSDFFTEFIDEAFKDLNQLNIVDSSGNDVTEEFIENNLNHYKSKNYEVIQKLIESENLSVSYEELEHDLSKSQMNIQGSNITENKSKITYHIENAEGTSFRKEWTTQLIGRITYESNTHRIVSAGDPILSLKLANFGAAFSPYLDRISTGKQINSTTVDFSGTYTMKATLGFEIGGFPVGKTLDFGRYTDSFRAVPSF